MKMKYTASIIAALFITACTGAQPQTPEEAYLAFKSEYAAAKAQYVLAKSKCDKMPAEHKCHARLADAAKFGKEIESTMETLDALDEAGFYDADMISRARTMLSQYLIDKALEKALGM